MLGRLKRFLALSSQERKHAIRRRLDFTAGAATFGLFGVRLHRWQRFAYLSYIPDAIREFGAFQDFDAYSSAWNARNGRRNAGDYGRMLTLLLNASKVVEDGIPGDFAELGVYKGNSAKVLARVLATRAPERQIHLFDTFSGFDPRDLVGVDASQVALFHDVSLSEVSHFVGHVEHCKYWPGYFPESARELPAKLKFALVHLDLDLYAPMKAALEFFYSRMEPGAIMVVHDYSSGHWPGVPAAVDEFLTDKPEWLVLISDKSGSAIFRKV